MSISATGVGIAPLWKRFGIALIVMATLSGVSILMKPLLN
jgi:hypothetical protein